MKKKLLLTAIFVFLAILIVASGLIGQNEKDKLKDENRLNNPNLSLNTGSCNSCHSRFAPFAIETKILKEKIEEKTYFNLSIKATNNRSHEVRELTGSIKGIKNISREKYAEFQDSVLLGQTNQHDSPIEVNSDYAVFTLDGDEGITGTNDIDLRIMSPNNEEWSSTSSGADEQIILSSDDIKKGGIGQYTASVDGLTGEGQISYNLNVTVIYGNPNSIKYGNDLKSGESYSFEWNLFLNQEEIDDFYWEVSGTVYYDHDDSEIDDIENYTYIGNLETNISFDEKKGFETLKYGQFFGLLSMGLFVFAIVTGYSKPFNVFIEKALKIKFGNIHCLSSYAIIFLFSIHSIILLIKYYPRAESGFLLCGLASILFLIFGFTSLWRSEIIKKIGFKQWKLLHIALTVLTIILVLAHVIDAGSHF